jgi:ketosteroid isomerase-like protein
VTSRDWAPPGLSRTRCQRCATERALASGFYLTLVLLLLGSLTNPALAKMYSCRDGAGRITLRDVPCKRGERDRYTATGARTHESSATRAREVPGSQPITESQVRELVDGIDAARRRRDVEAMLAYLAPDAVVEVEYRLPQGMQFKRFNKTEYAAYLRGEAALVDGFDFQRERTRILVTPRTGEAEIASTLRETIRVQGKALTGMTRSKSLVEVRDGRPQVTMVRAVTSFEAPETTSRAGK